ncbi:MAG: aminopeptidase N [Propioniciclava sp.]
MFPANITRDEAVARSQQVTVTSYQVVIDLTGRHANGTPLADPETTFTSTTQIRFSSIDCVVNANLLAEELTSAVLDGETLAPDAFDGEHLTLDVSEGPHVLSVTAVMRYSRTGEGLHRFVDPADDQMYLYTQFEVADARRMYCTFEQPDLKARFTLSVVADPDWTVVSNSSAVIPAVRDDDYARWDFAPTEPISTYITALVAGPFVTVSDRFVREDGSTIPLSILTRASLAQHLDADRIFDTTRRGFAFFEHHFGRQYPFHDYAQVFVPEFNFGAMENAGCVTFRDEYIFRSRQTSGAYESRDNTILHEMAHMWFGDLVTMTWWDDLWLNESFAEWASHFAQAQIATDVGGRPNPWATFCNSRKTWAYRQDQLPSTHPIAADMVDLEAVELNFDGITYAKGASALRQLVAFVGREDFLAGVRSYFAEFAYGNSQLADLLRHLEAASGRDLGFFTTQWLLTAGVNTLTADFETDGEAFTRFGISQSAAPEWPTLRRHRIAVGCYNVVDGVLTRTDRVEFDIDGAMTEVPALVGRPRPDLLLVNDDDLTYAKIRLDPQSLDTLVGHIDALDSDLARALAWGATWDLTRDGEMDPADYVELVLRGVAVETDLTAVAAVLGQARTAIELYTPADRRADLADHWQVGVARLMQAAEPGSDHQLALVRALALAMNDTVGADLLQAWLAGEELPDGLVLDADLRWRLVAALARLGAIDDAAIAAEASADRTSSGAEQAAGARSARADAAAKADAWTTATAGKVPNETHAQIVRQFWQFGQNELLTPYAQRYLDVVAAIGEQRDGWGAASSTLRQAVLTWLFPLPIADRDFIGRLDAFLAAHAFPESVVRLVNERRDDAVRAIRNREINTGRGASA